MSLPDTESPHPAHTTLDEYPTRALVDAFLGDQAHAAAAVRAALEAIARAVDAAVPRLQRGGRLVYVGAGTSGRLGLLDSVELHPTFSWPPERSVALLAGGDTAIRTAVEGAEDDAAAGQRAIADARVSSDDVVILLAASGRTPFVVGALRAARSAGALTIGIANNAGSPLSQEAEIGVTIATGSEVISGSTRLKAGTAQKIALNTLSSAIMVRLHKVYGNLMVDVRPTNAKLVARAVRLTVHATGASEAVAREALAQSGHEVKTAIVMLATGLSAEDARQRLAEVHGSVRAAIAK